MTNDIVSGCIRIIYSSSKKDEVRSWASALKRLGGYVGVADLRYQRLNMQIIETSIHKASGFSTDFFHTLIKQRRYVSCQSYLIFLRKAIFG
ncbi:hypothetical protein QUA56_21335 [Microcoleus sp. N3A4]|uniref:hypothetical protein n=1 Tax=Microcoleus sp. N3A4 TaxID=3055379 RepID=UPI002FCF524F